MQSTFFKLSLVVTLVVFGFTACDQPTNNFNQEEKKEKQKKVTQMINIS